MRKPGSSDAERYFARSQKKDDKVVRQKEKTERDRDSRMARLRDLRLARDVGQAAAPAADATPDADLTPDAGRAEAPENPEDLSARLPQVHPHRS